MRSRWAVSWPSLVGVGICLLAITIQAGMRFPSTTALAAEVVAQQSKSEAKPKEAAEDQKELTIRNVIKTEVKYSIRVQGGGAKPADKSIKPGAIDRYPGDDAFDIEFRSEGREISYRLEPHRPYSFRYDKEGKLNLYQGAHGRSDAEDLAPWVPTPMPIVEKMLEFAGVKKGDVVYDLGCGDGRIVIAAAKAYGARGVGVDIDPQRIKESKAAAKEAGVESLVEFRLADATKVDFSEATVLGLYLLSESNELLRPAMEKQLKPGTRIVCHDYPVPGWKSLKRDSIVDKAGKEHVLYLYVR
jgi:SAM-dependent methyltransferase